MGNQELLTMPLLWTSWDGLYPRVPGTVICLLVLSLSYLFSTLLCPGRLAFEDQREGGGWGWALCFSHSLLRCHVSGSGWIPPLSKVPCRSLREIPQGPCKPAVRALALPQRRTLCRWCGSSPRRRWAMGRASPWCPPWLHGATRPCS